MNSFCNKLILYSFIIIFGFTLCPASSWAFSSANIPLDSPVYLCLEKLAGMGLITSDIKGLKPWSKAEAARLLTEAEAASKKKGAAASSFADELIAKLREALPREISLSEHPDLSAPPFDIVPVSSVRLRGIYLDGTPRSYNRNSWDSAHQSAFGFIGGDLRPLGDGSQIHTTGTEGTPLLENNNGVIHSRGVSSELRWAAAGHIGSSFTALIEPSLFIADGNNSIKLNRGYVKLGGGGLELEVGRDENWFGQGYRGTTTLTSNAGNFDLIKLSSPEPVDVAWVKNWLGGVKYTLFFSRFDETDKGTTDNRQPWFIGAKLAIKPVDMFEIGANFVRQFGGPGFRGNSGLTDSIFGGGENDHSNSIAGVDFRFRFKSLRNTEVHWEFSGEDNAGGVWPIVESYVTGFYVPCITESCRDDFRFEYFYGSEMLYGDWQFPRGYVYKNMTPGHSQGTNTQDFFSRYSHWFGARNNLALEYFYTERGRSHRDRNSNQVMESKHAGRVSWMLPLYGVVDAELEYGVEFIDNLNLVKGKGQTNQLLAIELTYRY